MKQRRGIECRSGRKRFNAREDEQVQMKQLQFGGRWCFPLPFICLLA